MARPPKPKRKVSAGRVTVAGKAANGAGTVFWEADRARWRARFVDPATGRTRSVTAPTQEEVIRRRQAKLAELDATRPVGALGADPTVSELATWWLEHVAPERARPNTLRSYGQDVRRICDVIGALPVSALDVATARATVTKIRGRYGRGTTANARARLRQICEAAVDLELLARNPAARISMARRTEGERVRHRVLTAPEITRLLDALEPEQRTLDAAIGLLFTAGVRCSEALGLAWSDIDLDAGTAEIVRGCTYEPEGGCRLDTPKTERTEGTVILHPRVVGLLRAHRRRQLEGRLAVGPEWATVTYEGQRLELVFPSTRGGLQREQAVGAALSRALVRAGLEPSSSTHMGRRSVVTALAEAGVPLDDIADHVGHADTKTTRGYVQSRRERSRSTAEVAATLIG